ncbi:MAG TPA: peptidoglycan editing factor PgeF [Steroidobacteraceae bacterium]|nr:peptidoglycan editing factor PgeF [Steroidobacteraceae bacterium]
MTAPVWIDAQWPCPPNVRAIATTRIGGVSGGAYESLNLAMHVGDDPLSVRRNREILRTSAQFPREPAWLNQIHGIEVVEAQEFSAPPAADAAVAIHNSNVCVVMTADCLPVLFCDRTGTRVAAAHAGWRGLVGGVLQATIRALRCDPAELIAWLGPAIEQDAFEVGAEVREQFVAVDSEHTVSFVQNAQGRWQADLYGLARRTLERAGVPFIFGGGFRCFADRERFFSYRRDQRTGRMASLIWLRSERE